MICLRIELSILGENEGTHVSRACLHRFCLWAFRLRLYGQSKTVALKLLSLFRGLTVFAVYV